MGKKMGDLINADLRKWESNCEEIRKALSVIAQAFNECAKQIQSIDFKRNDKN